MAGTAGSVAPVFRDGGYDDTVIYDFYHALIHNNKLYFCRQDGTIGHEPQEESDEYWFLSLDGNFGDAKKLGGETAAQWQTKIDVEKERIDQIVAMEESTGGNVESEVLDMRIGADGITYDSAGTAVREQIGNLDGKIDNEISSVKSDLSEIEGAILTSNVMQGTHISVNTDFSQKANVSNENGADILHTGKNILSKPYYMGSPTSNGITFVYNDADGTVSAAGTATASASYAFRPSTQRRDIKAGTYTLSGCPSGGSSSTYRMVLGITGVGEMYEHGDGLTFTIEEDTTFYLSFKVYEGQTVDFTISPMIEVGGNKTEYQTYISETLTMENTLEIPLYYGVNNFFSNEEITLEYYAGNNFDKVANVKNFGAVGDGFTDDTAAINRALAVGTNGEVFFPIGTYLVSGTLNVHTNTKVRGCGDLTRIKLANSYKLTAYAWRDYGNFTDRKPIMVLDENADCCALEDFCIEGQTSAFVDERVDGLAVRGTNHTIRNIKISNINYFPNSWSGITNGFGVFVFNASIIGIENLNIFNCQYQDIGFENADTVTLKNSKFGSANQTGVQVHRNCKNISINHNTIDLAERENGHSALTFDAPQEVAMSNIHASDNYIVGGVSFVGGGENDVFLTDNYINGVIQSNTEDYYILNIDIRGNHIYGRIKLYADNAMICNNIISNDRTDSRMISLYGNNAVVEQNSAIGEGSSNITITPH